MGTENLMKWDMRLEYAKEKINDKTEKNKRKYVSQEDKEKARETVERVANEISEYLNDPNISEDVRESMAKESRKQLVLIRKEIAKLQTMLKTAQ